MIGKNETTGTRGARRQPRRVPGWVNALCYVIAAAVVGYNAYFHANHLTDDSFALEAFLRGSTRIFVEMVVPIVTAGLLVYAARRLKPGKARTALAWIGWVVFAFEFVWWGWLRYVVMYGPSMLFPPFG